MKDPSVVVAVPPSGNPPAAKLSPIQMARCKGRTKRVGDGCGVGGGAGVGEGAGAGEVAGGGGVELGLPVEDGAGGV